MQFTLVNSYNKLCNIKFVPFWFNSLFFFLTQRNFKSDFKTCFSKKASFKSFKSEKNLVLLSTQSKKNFWLYIFECEGLSINSD